MLSLVKLAHAKGADVIILTSPHGHTTRGSFSMPNGVAQSYPTAVAANVPDASLIPSVANSAPTIDILGTGTAIPINARMLRINQAMRRVALETGAVLIDSETYWFKAVEVYGQDALFNTGESVHPNLLGHQSSYQAAIDDFLKSIFRSWQTTTPQTRRLTGRVEVNTDLDTSGAYGMTVYPAATGESALRVRNFAGTTLLEHNATDDAIEVKNGIHRTGENVEHVGAGFVSGGNPNAKELWQALYSLQIASPVVITVPSGVSILVVHATQSGVNGTKSEAYIVSAKSGSWAAITSMGKALGNAGGGPDSLYSIAGNASASTVTITVGFANVSLKYYWHRF
jgi:hypothetical protein